MQQVITPAETLEGEVAILDAVVGAGLLLDAAKMGLFLDTFTPTEDSVRADFIAAIPTFTGYALVSMSWSPVGISGDDGAQSVSNRCFFQATAPIADQRVGGFFIEQPGAGPTGSVMYGIFPGGVDLSTALAFVAITVTLGAAGPINAVVES